MAPGATFVPLTVREFSDTLLIFLLRANRPEKYRGNFRLNALVDGLRRAEEGGEGGARPGPLPAP